MLTFAQAGWMALTTILIVFLCLALLYGMLLLSRMLFVKGTVAAQPGGKAAQDDEELCAAIMAAAIDTFLAARRKGDYRMKKQYRITCNGKAYELEVEDLNGNVSAAFQARGTSDAGEDTRPLPKLRAPEKEVYEAPQASKAAAAGVRDTLPLDASVISAPIPGTVLSLAVKAGERVRKGQVLLVLEAMKMQNEILANRDGVVKEICITVGQTTNSGEPLLILE